MFSATGGQLAFTMLLATPLSMLTGHDCVHSARSDDHRKGLGGTEASSDHFRAEARTWPFAPSHSGPTRDPRTTNFIQQRTDGSTTTGMVVFV